MIAWPTASDRAPPRHRHPPARDHRARSTTRLEVLARGVGRRPRRHAAESAARARALRQLRRRPVRGRPHGRGIRRLLRRARGALDALAHHRRAARPAEPRARPRAQAAPARVGVRARRRPHHVDVRPARRPQRALQPARARRAGHRVPRRTTTGRWTTASTAATRPTGSWCRGRSPRRPAPTPADERVVASVAVPHDIETMRREAPADAAAWRVRVREEFLARLAEGLVVGGFDDERGYLFVRP